MLVISGGVELELFHLALKFHRISQCCLLAVFTHVTTDFFCLALMLVNRDGYFQTKPAKLFLTLRAHNIHAASILLHDWVAGWAGFCVQFHPLISIVIWTPQPRFPHFYHLTAHRLMTRPPTIKAEAIQTAWTRHIKFTEVLVFQFDDHIAVLTGAPAGCFRDLDVWFVHEELVSLVLLLGKNPLKYRSR